MLALTPTLDKRFTTFSNTALTGATLSNHERALAVLTTVFVLEDNDLIEQAVVCAKQAGITNEEIGQTSAIVLAVQGVFKHYDLELVASRKAATV
jgi:alkylhydroperoxidase/carboxymuconolactone decarboxylase family protein YurZ